MCSIRNGKTNPIRNPNPSDSIGPSRRNDLALLQRHDSPEKGYEWLRKLDATFTNTRLMDFADAEAGATGRRHQLWICLTRVCIRSKETSRGLQHSRQRHACRHHAIALVGARQRSGSKSASMNSSPRLRADSLRA